MPLNNRQLRFLRGLTHKLHPVVIVADKGLTENVLAEIESALVAHAAVAEAAVVGVHDPLKGQVPVGFLVLKVGPDRDDDEVVAARLPERPKAPRVIRSPGLRHALVLIFITAALLTPADPLSQILLAVPLTLLYGLSFLLSSAIHRSRRSRRAPAPDDAAGD